MMLTAGTAHFYILHIFEDDLVAQRLGARFPPLGFRFHVSVTPCGFHARRNEVWVGFYRGFSRIPLPEISFHNFSMLISCISFHFISLAPVMVREAWSADTLAIHRS